MFPTRMFLVAAALCLATPAFAQDDSTTVEDVKLSGSRIVRQDFEAISPVTTVGSEDLQLSPSHYPLGWRNDAEQTSSRARSRGSRGASSVRVIRACEVSLRLGDEDCAGN